MVISVSALYALGGFLVPILVMILHTLGIATPILGQLARLWSVTPEVPDPNKAPLTANHPIINTILSKLRLLEAASAAPVSTPTPPSKP